MPSDALQVSTVLYSYRIPDLPTAVEKMGTEADFWEQNGNNNDFFRCLQSFKSDQGLVSTTDASKLNLDTVEVWGSSPHVPTI
jgi:hypothetical protein